VGRGMLRDPMAPLTGPLGATVATTHTTTEAAAGELHRAVGFVSSSKLNGVAAGVERSLLPRCGKSKRPSIYAYRRLHVCVVSCLSK